MCGSRSKRSARSTPRESCAYSTDSRAKEATMDKGNERPFAAVMNLVNGYRVSQAIHVAAALGVADLLKDGPRSSDDLA